MMLDTVEKFRSEEKRVNFLQCPAQTARGGMVERIRKVMAGSSRMN
jgi:hypothetical protein